MKYLALLSAALCLLAARQADITPPSIVFGVPDGAVVKAGAYGNAPIDEKATDDGSGVHTFQVNTTGRSATVSAPPGTSYVAARLYVPVGDWTITANAVDYASNASSKSILVHVVK